MTSKMMCLPWLHGAIAVVGLLYARDVCFAGADGLDAKIEKNQVVVSYDGQLFFAYKFEGRQKPVIYPVIGPDGVAMTRDYPLKSAVEGEPTDHPHHESLWFTHGKVNGENFWAPGKTRIASSRPPKVEIAGNTVTIYAWNKWIGQDGSTVVCTDSEVISGTVVSDEVRLLDYSKTITASHGPVKFYDDKEGVMAIRVNPAFQANRTGALVNSEDDKGTEAWGKNAKWVDCSGPYNGSTYGVAVFDHPSNLRYPTTWHARDYGLIGANPFGLTQFQGRPPGSGDYLIPSSKSLTLRYRFVFHRGDSKKANVAKLFDDWQSAMSVDGDSSSPATSSVR